MLRRTRCRARRPSGCAPRSWTTFRPRRGSSRGSPTGSRCSRGWSAPRSTSVEKRIGETTRAELDGARQPVREARRGLPGAGWRRTRRSRPRSVHRGVDRPDSLRHRRGQGRRRSPPTGAAESGPSEPGCRTIRARTSSRSLKDPDPMRRFAAVMELARFRTPAVVERARRDAAGPRELRPRRKRPDAPQDQRALVDPGDHQGAARRRLLRAFLGARRAEVDDDRGRRLRPGRGRGRAREGRPRVGGLVGG